MYMLQCIVNIVLSKSMLFDGQSTYPLLVNVVGLELGAEELCSFHNFLGMCNGAVSSTKA